MKRYVPFMIIAGVLTIAVGAGLTLYRSGQKASPRPDASSGASVARPAHVRGAASAPVTLEEFGDFQCPPCRTMHPEIKKIEAEYGPRLRVVFHHFPLAARHKHAVEAARAAEAAGLQGRFWEMHDLLYENQKAWSDAADARPVFIGYARSLGLNAERFTRDMDGLEVQSRILLDQQRGQSLGVKGTPTLFINGRELPPASMTTSGIRAAINSALGEKGS